MAVGVSTQSFVPANQVLDHLSHTLNCSSLFLKTNQNSRINLIEVQDLSHNLNREERLNIPYPKCLGLEVFQISELFGVWGYLYKLYWLSSSNLKI
jgi:hypothetical protein